MAIRDWIDDYLNRHRIRFLPHDWPASGDADETREFVADWIRVFALKQVTEVEADAASRRLLLSPPNWRREHIPAVISAIEAMRAERSPAASIGGDREAARAASRGCEHCCGDGLALVFHLSPDPSRGIPPQSAAYCTCIHGRWIKRNHAEKSQEYLRRIPDLVDVLNGFGDWLVEPDPTPDPTPVTHHRGQYHLVGPRLRNDKPGLALQFLVEFLAAGPKPMEEVLAAGRDVYGISPHLILDASSRLQVVKSTDHGHQTWDLEQGTLE